MTPERFQELWLETNTGLDLQDELREALTAFIHTEAMREKAEFARYHQSFWPCIIEGKDCENEQHDWTDASWEKYLGRLP